MWSWVEATQTQNDYTKKDHSSYNGKIKVYVSTANPYGGLILIKRCFCENDEEIQQSIRDSIPSADNQHYLWAELLDHCVESYLGKPNVFFIYRLQGISIFNDAKARARNYPENLIPEETMWRILTEMERPLACAKPHHIFLSSDYRIQYIELGYGTKIYFSHALNSILPYASPIQRRAVIQGYRDIAEIPQDLNKSNVYSLGITFLYMCLLDLPQFITSLRDLQRNLDHRIDDMGIYSEKLTMFLKRMLIVDEALRPDFVQLEKELPIIEKIDEPPYHDQYKPPISEIAVLLEHYAVITDHLRDRCANGFVRVALGAPITRPSSCIICALDITTKQPFTLELVKSSLLSLISTLRDTDTIRLVCASHPYRRISSWTRCDDAGKEALRGAIRMMMSGVTSNAHVRISSYLSALQKRRHSAQNLSLLLFTDAQKEKYINARDLVCSMPQYSVHCFLYNDSIRGLAFPAAQNLAAACCNGALHCIGNRNEAKRAAAITAARLFATVARNIKVELINAPQTHYGCELARVYQPLKRLPDLYEDGVVTVAFKIRVKAIHLHSRATCVPAIAKVTYKTAAGEELTEQREIKLELFPGDQCYPFPLLDPVVTRTCLSAVAGNAIHEVLRYARAGHFEEAASLLQQTEERLKGQVDFAGVAGDLEYARKAMKDGWKSEVCTRLVASSKCLLHSAVGVDHFRCATRPMQLASQ